mmetsp:Transcript_13724/g.22385  ORF Transcript_13724/g.22385 Transcript_13724/m.22385 type:complete len:302 (+) Transcript_13724:180-1085(+)
MLAVRLFPHASELFAAKKVFSKAGKVSCRYSQPSVWNLGIRNLAGSGPKRSTSFKAQELHRDKDEFFANWSWFLKLFGYYGKESTDIRTGQALFRSCEEQSILVARDESFGLNFEWDSKKNFMVRQQLVLLHLWMLHRRLVSDEIPGGKELQEAVFDTFWENTTRRIRATGVPEMSVNKHLNVVQKSCFTAAVNYDYGYNLQDENLELGSTIWRSIFGSEAKTPDQCVYRMAEYVRTQTEDLEKLDEQHLRKGQVNWITTDTDPANLFGEWRQAISVSGRAYWWNVKTRESQWEHPDNIET